MKLTPEDALKQIFEEYKDRGLLSLYLYGSILTKDYIEGESDIDSIGFVNEDVLIALENEIKNKLCKISSFDKFGFRFLYKSELDTGVVKGNLASFIDPQLLLLDFPHWKHIIGENYSRSSFALEDINTADAVERRLNHLIRIEDGSYKTAPGEKHILYSKVLARIIFHLQKERGIDEPFSYSSIVLHANPEEKLVAEAVLDCKNNKWNIDVHQKNVPIYEKYVNFLKSKI
ncbi:MAG: hypothetical protein V4469_00145 [Patescibacteria group bacterium]